ncbi:MAG: PAS domain S-box protein, partial [Pseudomonadota bacterium]|nr:PAS domain S-box protein [Pseudomonadota bacterium]
MRAHDWTGSPLGPLETWPQSLRTVVGLLLNSKFPMFLAWGPELAFLYNDGYAPILGAKHPDALGRPFQDIWFEIWDDIYPLVERALAGEATFHENLPLTMLRKGFEELTYFTFSYSPVRDEGGAVAGLFCACTETTGQVLAEEARRKSEERQRAIVEATPECVKIVAPDGSLVHMNPAGLRMIQAPSLAAVHGTSVFDVIAPHDRDEWRARHERICAGESMSWEFDIVGLAGRRRRMESHAVPIAMPDGTVAQLAVTRDITARTETEAALRASEERYRSFIAHSSEGIWRLDLDPPLDTSLPVDQQVELAYRNGRFAECNDVMARMYGLTSAEDVVGRTLDLTLPASDPDARAYLAGVIRAGYSVTDVESVERNAAGEAVHFANSMVGVVEDGRLKHVWGIQRDISERRRAEEALRRSEERFRSLVEATTAVVWMTDTEGAIVAENPSWAAFTGQTEAEYRGWGWLDAVHPDDRARTAEVWRSALAALRPYDCEYRLRRHDGAYRDTVARGVPIAGPDGGVREWIGANIDVTERKRAEEHKTLLIHELNHRVKNTLATVQSIAAQTLRNAPSTEQARAAFESRLMALSRAHDVLTRENWEGASLREIVLQALEPYANRREDRLHLSGRDIRLVPRAALALAMALQELATNAVKYGALSNGAGEIDIAWKLDRKADPPRLRLRWEERGGPPVSPPARRGFGSRLIERSLAQDLDGEVRIAFAPTGVVCTVDAPLQHQEHLFGQPHVDPASA